MQGHINTWGHHPVQLHALIRPRIFAIFTTEWWQSWSGSTVVWRLVAGISAKDGAMVWPGRGTNLTWDGTEEKTLEHQLGADRCDDDQTQESYFLSLPPGFHLEFNEWQVEESFVRQKEESGRFGEQVIRLELWAGAGRGRAVAKARQQAVQESETVWSWCGSITFKCFHLCRWFLGIWQDVNKWELIFSSAKAKWDELFVSQCTGCFFHWYPPKKLK